MMRNGLLKWRSHTEYERLCSKVAYGAVKDPEFVELIEHLRRCSDCRTLLVNFTGIIANIVPKIAQGWSGTRMSQGEPNGLPESKYDRALVDYALGTHPARNRWSRIIAWGAPALLSVLLIIVYAGMYGRHPKTSQPAPASTSEQGAGGDRNQEQKAAQLQEQVKTAQQRVKNLEFLLQTTRETTAGVQNQKNELANRVELYEKTLAERQQIIEKQNSDLEQLRRDVAATNTALNAAKVAESIQQADLVRTRAQLAATTDLLNRQRQINNALKRVQELMGATDLHVISVPPMEPAVQRSQPSGRILYAEGKEAMFYGFNLSDTSQDANVSYHVWGEKLRTREAIKSLGVFEPDAKNNSLWLLTFTDPSVLARVDRILVTAETGTVVRNHPTGKTILIANLSNRSNHP